VPDEGVVDLQLSRIIVRKIHWCLGRSQGHFVHNIGGRWVIYKQRNHHEQRLNFSANPRENLLFLAKNAMAVLHGPLRNMGTI
jgi:hypothetical protein